MQKYFSTVSSLPIIAGEDKKSLGHINGAFVNPETGQIIGFLVGFGKILVPTDIQKWGNESIQVSDEEALVSPWDVLRIQSYGIKRTFLNGKKIVSKSGKKLGRLRDFSFDPAGNALATIDVSKKIWPFEWAKRSFPAKDIAEILDSAIILAIDPEAEEKIKEPVLQPS
ncbi:MAG: PRC-barrel domain-containing protein [Candidatus Gracilibacteria bacterium]